MPAAAGDAKHEFDSRKKKVTALLEESAGERCVFGLIVKLMYLI
jgi:hypothetical protein